MKPQTWKRFAFILKSMIWASALYVALMLALNWDDVSGAMSGKNNITVVTNDEQLPQYPRVNCPARNPDHVSIIKSFITIVKTVTGLTRVSTSL